MDKQLAGCTGCGAPLIPTTSFPKFEFYCLDCGRKLGFLSPRGIPSTPENLARYDALKAEWDEHAKPFLRVGRWWIRDCEKCSPRGETHDAHATDEERAAHEAALEWLRERARVPV